MFFTKAGRVIAWLAVAFGGLRIALGFGLAGGNPAAAQRYLGSATTGDAIDQGLMLVVFGIAIGILTDISRSVASKSE